MNYENWSVLGVSRVVEFQSLKKKMVLVAFVAASLMGVVVHAADLLWTGRYRVEGNFIKNYTLDKNQGIEDSFILHHLIMEPKITASDGFNIYSRFDIFNNSLPGSQHGQVFGDYPSNPSSSNLPAAQPAAVQSHAEAPETILVNGLYLNWVNEFGALVAGRVPFHFGLGMYYNSGSGNFDHYIGNKDLVGYKLALGNITIMPAYGKVREGVLTNEDDINDYLIVAEYNNPETDLSFGVIYDQRNAPQDNLNTDPQQGNDYPAGQLNSTYFSTMNSTFTNPQITSGYHAYNLNFYVKKKYENWNLGAELGFLNGGSGVSVNTATANGQSVDLNGYGLAAEVGYKTGNLKLNIRGGLASGDDPDTPRIESYFFSPNYHVAMMMFTFPMGQYDVLKSGLAGTRPATAPFAQGTSQATMAGLDTEIITNAIYFAPNLTVTLGDRYDFLATFCYANELKSPVSSANPPAGYNGNIGNSLGFETDFGLNYHPNDKFTWETTVGLFFPGNAWAGPSGYATDWAYGATSKAAINF